MAATAATMNSGLRDGSPNSWRWKGRKAVARIAGGYVRTPLQIPASFNGTLKIIPFIVFPFGSVFCFSRDCDAKKWNDFFQSRSKIIFLSTNFFYLLGQTLRLCIADLLQSFPDINSAPENLRRAALIPDIPRTRQLLAIWSPPPSYPPSKYSIPQR